MNKRNTGKIYTKTGDKGNTSLFNGLKVKKSNKIIEALGSIDELNAVLGTIQLFELLQIQNELMQINSFIAGFKIKIPSEKHLEEKIDKMQKELPELKNFILPQGPIHFARAVCRRAERNVIKIKSARLAARQVTQLHSNTIKYMNRLSDYLFVLARFENHKKRVREIVWKQN